MSEKSGKYGTFNDLCLNRATGQVTGSASYRGMFIEARHTKMTASTWEEIYAAKTEQRENYRQ